MIIDVYKRPQYLLEEEGEDYDLNGRYQLEADLELGWLERSIGTNAEPFTGRLDGNGHVINGLTRPLFGVMKRARVDNLFLSGAETVSYTHLHRYDEAVQGVGDDYLL